jgi:hypothetical protein
MSLYDAAWGRMLTTDWMHNLTNLQIRALPHHGGHLPTVYRYLNTFLDKHMLDRSFVVCVPVNCPDPWPPMLDGIYGAAGSDVDAGAMFLGCLLCRAAIARGELWICAPYPVFTNRPDPRKWHPRRYTVWHNAPAQVPSIPRLFR